MYTLSDMVKNAVTNGRNISRHDDFNNQQWNDYYSDSIGKKTILWGLGDFIFFLNTRLENIKQISYIIDTHKEGGNLSEYLDDYSISISGPNLLNKLINDDTIFLINSEFHYDEIIDTLHSNGFTHIYVPIIMESNMFLCDPDVYAKQFKYDNVPVNDKKVLFSNLGTNTDFGHNKYITQQLLKIRNDLDIVWIVRDTNIKVPQGVRKVNSKKLNKVHYEFDTAKIVVFDYGLDHRIKKNNDQKYIVVKHWASVTLKSFGLEHLNHIGNYKGIEAFKALGKATDYIIGGGKFDEDISRANFAFTGDFLHFGSPRSDILFSSNYTKEQILNNLKLSNKNKYLLFAPTFRRKDNKNYFDLQLDFKNLIKALNSCKIGQWKILLRLHPYLAAEGKKISNFDFVIDVSNYPDSQELVAISDAMITDYSSIMFEPAFVRKPVFLYAPDRHEYINGERGLLIDYDTLPFPIAETNEQLAKNILSFDKEKYIHDVDAFMEKYDVHEDGHASERTAKFISDLIDGKVE